MEIAVDPRLELELFNTTLPVRNAALDSSTLLIDSTVKISQVMDYASKRGSSIVQRVLERVDCALASPRAWVTGALLSLGVGALASSGASHAVQSDSLFKSGIGVLASLSYYGIMCGIVDQIRKIHQSGSVPESLSLGKLAGNGFRYLIWTLWACAQSPLQGFFLATRAPGAILTGVLLSQKFKAKKTPLEYLGAASLASAVVGAAGYGIAQVASRSLATGLEVIASASLLGVAVFGCRDQIHRLRLKGTSGTSLLLQGSFAMNYSLWGVFSAMDSKPLAACSFGLAAIMSWACVAQFSGRINPLALKTVEDGERDK